MISTRLELKLNDNITRKPACLMESVIKEFEIYPHIYLKQVKHLLSLYNFCTLYSYFQLKAESGKIGEESKINFCKMLTFKSPSESTFPNNHTRAYFLI